MTAAEEPPSDVPPSDVPPSDVPPSDVPPPAAPVAVPAAPGGWMWPMFYGWLYLVPLLLLTGAIRAGTKTSWLTYAQARPVQEFTDALLITGLVLNALVPLAGVGLARYRRLDEWGERWRLSLIWMAAVFVVFLVGAGAAPYSVIGHNPGQPKPHPVVSHCVEHSGGDNRCPGG